MPIQFPTKPYTVTQASIAGVVYRPLQMHLDNRGILAEVFRPDWGIPMAPVQWNIVKTRTDTFRGMKVHMDRADYLVGLQGRILVGLRDLRKGSPTFGLANLLELPPEQTTAVYIPPGVLHGFYFCEPCMHLYALTSIWEPDDEMGCHWSDPTLDINWPIDTPPTIVPRDEQYGGLAELMEKLEPYQPFIK